MTELRAEWVWEPGRRSVPSPERDPTQLTLPLAG